MDSDTDLVARMDWVSTEHDVDALLKVMAGWMEHERLEELVERLPGCLAGRIGVASVVVIQETSGERVVKAAHVQGEVSSLEAWGQRLNVGALAARPGPAELAPPEDEPWASGLTLPLDLGEGVEAVLALLSWTRPFDRRSRRLASRLAQGAAATLKRARQAALAEEARDRAQQQAQAWEARATQALAMVHGLGEGVVTLNEAGEVTFANASVARLLGQPVEVLQGRDFHGLVHPQGRCGGDGEPCALELAISRGAEVRSHQDTFERSDGMRFTTLTTIGPQPDASAGRGLVAAIRDLSDYQNMKARQLLNDRMVAAGTLAAGMAHEINNPLAFVDANMRFALQALQGGSEVSPASMEEALIEALDGVQRMRRIVEGMGVFGRGAGESRGWINLEQCLADAMVVSAGEVKRVATLRRVGEPLGQVRANAAQMTLVLVNLLMNVVHAFDASHASPEVVVRTARTQEAESIEVRDNGRGMSGALSAQIFDPFFTTQPAGRGTGLGLFVARSLIHELGGELGCESRPGEGSCFRVVLPLAEAAG
ncbi:hypothetical protein DL240_13085 [Lujinxingia litoralis]|uniref:histidine kinase n=1 Tax=Lujinxingia litoralis TaxID=2211119 RepID=A0A328C9X7_9DELT|nr:ATP-binding protein [Lujinxingia litoralis]RAL21780.1 hypothetical protein DL240_13085 [Lujinxingia litoralis]